MLYQGSISKHLRTLAIPAATSLFFQSMFNITDVYFSGKISTNALAALSISTPIVFLILSISYGMSQAVTVLIGNALGAKKMNKAKQTVSHVFLIALFLSIAFTIIGLKISPYLLDLLGAKDEYLQTSLDYINTLFFGSFFFIYVYFTNAILAATGNLKSLRNIYIVVFFINILLDSWFVYGGLGIKPLGTKGVALATVIAQLLILLYLAYNLKKNILLQNIPHFIFDKKIIFSIIKQGIPPTINLLTMAIGMFIITYFASLYGKDVVAGMGIGLRAEQIILLPIALGISMAVLTLVSQNNGAKEYQRIEQIVHLATKYAFFISLIGGSFMLFNAELFASFFTTDANVTTQAILFIRVAAITLFAYVLIFNYLALLQGIQRPNIILYVSVSRQILFPIAVFSTLVYFKFPAISIWLAISVINWSSALFIRWYAKKTFLNSHNPQSSSII